MSDSEVYEDEPPHPADDDQEFDGDPLAEDDFEYVLVHKNQLRALLQRCHLCGKGYREKSDPEKRASSPRNKNPPQRKIHWTRRGTSVTAIYRCACVGENRIRWSSQPKVGDTETRQGNLELVAAAIAAPIAFVVSLDSGSTNCL
jgi:hypothetical protein